MTAHVHLVFKDLSEIMQRGKQFLGRFQSELASCWKQSHLNTSTHILSLDDTFLLSFSFLDFVYDSISLTTVSLFKFYNI